MLKILLVANFIHRPGGAGRLEAYLAKAISQRGYECILIALASPHKINEQIIKEAKYIKLYSARSIVFINSSRYQGVPISISLIEAHFGFWSLKMSSKCKFVITLEPVFSNFAILYNSITASNAKNVLPLMLAAESLEGWE
jgi:hypothetical protein